MTSMRILIFGATGPSGILLAREALSALPCTIVMYVRSPEKVPKDLVEHPAVTVVQGELTDVDAISKVMEGVDVVLSALGPSTQLTKGPFHPSDTPLARAYERIINAMHDHHVPRLIALGTASNETHEDKFDIRFYVLVQGVKTVARSAYKDVVALGETIRNLGGDLEWTIVRVPLLTNDESKAVRAGFIGDGTVNSTHLARAGFAAFVVEQLKGSSKWVRKAPILCSA